jgi:hypothetical protein
MQVCFQMLVETFAQEHSALVGSVARGRGGNQRRGVSVPAVLGSVIDFSSANPSRRLVMCGTMHWRSLSFWYKTLQKTAVTRRWEQKVCHIKYIFLSSDSL